MYVGRHESRRTRTARSRHDCCSFPQTSLSHQYCALLSDGFWTVSCGSIVFYRHVQLGNLRNSYSRISRIQRCDFVGKVASKRHGCLQVHKSPSRRFADNDALCHPDSRLRRTHLSTKTPSAPFRTFLRRRCRSGSQPTHRDAGALRMASQCCHLKTSKHGPLQRPQGEHVLEETTQGSFRAPR